MTGALWTATAAARAIGAQPAPGDATAWRATGVSIDSRAVKPGDLFVAIVGDRLDGHAFVKDAFERGAVAALVRQTPEGMSPDDPRLLHAADTLVGLEALAAAARNRTRAKVVAVTGSVGKTGVKEMLRRALGALGPCHASEGNLNNHWGAPLSLARLPVDDAYAVFELGMNHAGEIRPLAKLVRPDVALVTRIAPAHTAFFKNIEDIADAKAEIFEGLDADGAAIVNADDPMTARLAARAEALGVRRILRFGAAANADIRLIDVNLQETGSDIVADVRGQCLAYRLGAPGAHWAQNSLAVLAALYALDCDLGPAAAALALMRPPAGRGQRRHVAAPNGGFDLIDESYNASPAAVRAAFAGLALARPVANGRRVVVLGDMLELGERADADHADLATAFVEAKLDRAHAAGPKCRRFMDALPVAARGRWAEDAAALAAHADEIAEPGDVVLVKGSLGMGMTQVVKALEALAPVAGGGVHAV